MAEEATTVDRSLGTARDFDVRPDGSWLGVFERDGGLHVADAHGLGFPITGNLRYPMVRALGFDRVVLVDSAPRSNTAGGAVLSLDGDLHCEFTVGDGVRDVVVLDDTIAVTYFDEGVFSGRSPSDQGVAFFDFNGTLSGGYRSIFGSDAVDIADCYAACRAGSWLVFCAYEGFQLVRALPRKRAQEIAVVPPELHGASALSTLGDRVWFFSPYDSKGSLIAWQPNEAAREVGRYSGRLRGLGLGRFLSSGADGFTVITPELAG